MSNVVSLSLSESQNMSVPAQDGGSMKRNRKAAV